jgi:hypothetical protein
MLKTTIIQNGVLKQVPSKHAAILVAIKKASYVKDVAAESDTDAPGQGETVDTDALKPKRAYVRKDLRAEE